MKKDLNEIKLWRTNLQKEIDGCHSQKERNMMGQFATPDSLACDIMKEIKSLFHGGTVNFLEPSVGLGAFYDAFLRTFGNQASHALAFELDHDFYEGACQLWKDYDINFRNEDFLLAKQTGEKFNLLVANPPYVRHHYIDTKRKLFLQKEVLKLTGIHISGLAGLYCYFLILSKKWLADGGVSCWLIPTEFMDVNYGNAVKQFLIEQVQLLRVHRFDAEDTQFDDALVSSTVVLFRNTKPTNDDILFTTGTSINNPIRQFRISRNELEANVKWSPLFKEHSADKQEDKSCWLGNFFDVKRGIATGDNHFFIVNRQTVNQFNIPSNFLRLLLPSPRYVNDDIINPTLLKEKHSERELYLFSCGVSKTVLKNNYPGVYAYIEKGERDEVNKGYICRQRTPWYSCEERKPAPIVVPYMGRGEKSKRMFRFILNLSDAITTNVYLLLYPKKEYARYLKDPKVLNDIWVALNSTSRGALVNHGREYGGGLHKLEPKELLKVPVPEVASMLLSYRQSKEPTLF